MSDEETSGPGGPGAENAPRSAGPPAPGALRLRFTALSDVGRTRKDNQDSGYAGEHFLAVADGVGGAARGDVASSTAIEELRTLDVAPGNDLQGPMAEAIDRAHRMIAELVGQHPEIEGTSTTVTAAIFDGTRLGIGHVGDSRGYLLRAGKIHQVTTDHTFVQSLVDEGRITEEEARVHPHRNLILRAVDAREPDPDLFYVGLEAGDRILLCSDGVNASLDNQQIGALLGQGTIEHAAEELVRGALDAGSTDNVTVVVADVRSADSAADDAPAEETAPVSVGPMVVGAAAEKLPGLPSVSARRLRAMKRADTGELDPIPAEAAGATLTDVDPEEIRYAPRPPRRFAWLRRIAVVAVIGVLVYLAGSASYAWSQRQYYVATADDAVAIYQGVPAEVPVVRLHHVYESSGITVSELPDFNKRQVRDGIAARDLSDAKAIVQRLRRTAACAGATPSATPSPSPSPTRTATKKPTKKPTTRAGKKKAAAEAHKLAQASASASASPTPDSSSSSSDCESP